MSNKHKNISVISTGSWVPASVGGIKNTKDTYQIQINRLILKILIGIHEHEKQKKQRVAISYQLKLLTTLILLMSQYLMLFHMKTL